LAVGRDAVEAKLDLLAETSLPAVVLDGWQGWEEA
jgi:hypothetical protein